MEYYLDLVLVELAVLLKYLLPPLGKEFLRISDHVVLVDVDPAVLVDEAAVVDGGAGKIQVETALLGFLGEEVEPRGALLDGVADVAYSLVV